MLAIVIPYYKKTFFRETIESIAKQTCKDFVLYIGDDASEDSPLDIIEEFKNKIHIVYHRFDKNIGGKDLVAQWNRCIKLAQKEDWIWLFSDDDIMSPTCVDEFYKSIINDVNIQIVRFSKRFTNIESNEEFVTTYRKGYTEFKTFLFDAMDLTQNHITMTEFIFSRILYNKYNIVNFPMAWGSDKATYLEYVFHAKYVYNLNSIVNYKFSDLSLSAQKAIPYAKIKFSAKLSFIKWMRCFFDKIQDEYKDINVRKTKNLYINRIVYCVKQEKINFIQKILIAINLLPFVYSFTDLKSVLYLFTK